MLAGRAWCDLDSCRQRLRMGDVAARSAVHNSPNARLLAGDVDRIVTGVVLNEVEHPL